MVSLVVIVLLSYLVGSIPTAVVVSKWFFGFDIRQHGSGNAGGTNAARVMGWKVGVIVAALDILKGVVAALVISKLRIDPLPVGDFTISLMAGSAAVLGHVWTVFAGFRGGKGVATFIGSLLGVYPIALICFLVVFLVTGFTTKYVSLASMLAGATLPLTLALMNEIVPGVHVPGILFWFSAGLAVFIVYTHRANLRRLLAGQEKKFGAKTA